ncbi:hypothetical protein [Aegicerativicinus sediminis]|uniref:hypothetical protein n=1 Tax=Aegicerativicinus sediminis TaxID=2893202 RepID=UPI001E53E7AA|nr:hypothetical protein [Aegicerativicinus sediminis]
MKEQDIEALFEELQGQFDIDEPRDGHFERFQKKLDSEKKSGKIIQLNTWVTSAIAVAATLLIAFGIFKFNAVNEKPAGLASVSTEMSQTQQYFAMTIQNELAKIEGERSPETQQLVDDAIKRITTLEADYEKLEVDLQISGGDKRVIAAMIQNFQTRIQLLQDVMDQINQVKTYKDISNETNSTI